MSGATVTSALAAGFYGKVLTRGDFVSRRLPRVFLSYWDRWLQKSLRDATQGFGVRWVDSYLHAPIWRFALAPRVCSNTAWCGVLMPSVDRVGRFFPLTVAAQRAEPICAADMLGLKYDAWFDGVERTMLATLSDRFQIHELEVALEQAETSSLVHPFKEMFSNAATWEQQLSAQSVRPLHMGSAPGGLEGEGLSVWWTHAHESQPILNYGPLTSWLFMNLL